MVLRPVTSVAPDFAPGRVIRVYGMRRSGNHAVLDAFLRNAPGGDAVFFNNCKRAQDPLGSHRSLDIRQGGAKVQAAGLPLGEALALAGPTPLTIVSCEDMMPRPDARAIWHDEEQTVLIYRRFLNWAASLLQKIKGNSGYGAVERMRIMTRACRSYTVALQIASGREDVVPVLYDRWIASDTYRADRMAAIGLEPHDLDLGEVQRYGRGSSFQPEVRDAAELGADKRAELLAGDPEFGILLWLVAHDFELSELIAAHFPQDAARILQLAETAGLTFHLPEAGR